MHFEVQSVAPLIVATVDFLLGVVILLQNPKNLTNLAYGLFALSVAMWGFGVGSFYVVQDPTSIDFFARFLYFSGGSIPATFLFFCLIFNKKKTPSVTTILLAFLPTIVFVYLYFCTDLIIAGYTIAQNGTRGYQYGSLRYLFDIHLWLYFAIALPVLIKNYLTAESPTREHVAFITFGTYSVLAIAGVTNVIAPIYSDFNLVWIGPTTTIIWTWVVAYAVIRHQLFNIRLIAAELLIIGLWLVLLLRVGISNGYTDALINGAIFLATVVLGIFLIRSVLKEVRQREEIEKLSNEKSEFMSFASHEIRNPITAMRGYASLIVDGTIEGVGGQGKEIAQKILVNGDTVLSLISEFLNKSKVELGQIAYNVVDTDLGKTITSIGEGFKAHAREQGLTLDIKIDYPNLMVKADEAKLREVVGNIVDNSMKYTKAGGVTIEVEKRNGMGRVIVSDTGVGIPPETIAHLFQKFSRADAQKMNLLGTGLGLYLAKTFIEGMGGKIWAESDGKDKGSRFIIELHAAQ